MALSEAEINAIKTKIAEIDAIMQAGASSVSVDGMTISYDFDALRRERKELEQKLPTVTRRRRIAFSNNLGGAC